MNYSDYRFTLDINNAIQSQVSVPVRLGDTARRLCIGLVEGGKPYELVDGCLAVFAATKPDGNKILNACIIVDNKTVIYEFTDNTTNSAGLMNCEIRIFGVDGIMISSPCFSILIDERVARDEGIVSESEKNAIDQIFIGEEARAEAESARVEAESERAEAESARVEAESERAEAESERAEAERLRVENTGKAESAAASAAESAKFASDAAENAEYYAGRADEAAGTAGASAAEAEISSQAAKKSEEAAGSAANEAEGWFENAKSEAAKAATSEENAQASAIDAAAAAQAANEAADFLQGYMLSFVED